MSEIQSDPPSLGGFFPLTVIRSILYGDDKLIDVPFKSKASNDFSKVVKLPIGIGLYLASLDPNEVLFHVESFPDTQHSEVWLAFEWLESSARNIKVRAHLAEARRQRDKQSSRVKELMSSMPEQMSEVNKVHLAETILREMHYERFDKVLQYLNVAELMTKYEQEDKEELKGLSGQVLTQEGQAQQDSQSSGYVYRGTEVSEVTGGENIQENPSSTDQPSNPPVP